MHRVRERIRNYWIWKCELAKTYISSEKFRESPTFQEKETRERSVSRSLGQRLGIFGK